MRDMLEKLTARGIRIFPVHGMKEDGSCTCPKGLDCTTKGKHPFGVGWTTTATTDMRKVDNWLAHPYRLNWGVLTGLESKLFVIDIDPRAGGEEAWDALIEANEPLPKTMKALTGGGGIHFYLRRFGDEVRSGNNVLGPGIDIKGEHSLVVIPPSHHASGGMYTWEVGPNEMGPAKTPGWIRELLTEHRKKDDDHTPSFDDFYNVGERDNALFKGILRMLDQKIPPDFIRSVFIEKLESGQIEQSDADPITAEYIDKRIESTVKYRHDNPIPTGGDVDRLRSHTANAKRFAGKNGEDAIYVNGPGWYVWNGWRWEWDPEVQAVTRMMQECMDDLYHDASDFGNKDDTRKIAAWSITSQNANQLTSSISVSSKLENMSIDADELDKDPWLLNFRNGTLDLRTNQLVDHDRSNHITKCSPIEYDPSAKCPAWLETLHLAFDGNEQLIGYLQRALGYSVTGDTSEQCLFICWGEDGNNGKSTILEAFHRAVGRDYSQMTDPVIITTEAKSLYALSSMAVLRGSRIVNMNEAAEGQSLNEAMIKQVTGGDRIPAKFLHQNPFNYLPQFKVWMRTNAKPTIRGTDEAIWRRIKLIPFITPIPADKRKPRHVVDTQLDLERAGIMAWVIQGCLDWQDQGLNDPTEVVGATTDYRHEMDLISQFVDEVTEDSPGAQLPAPEIYRAYQIWCRENGYRYPMASNRFSRRLKKLNLMQEIEGGNRRVWAGIQLTEEWTVKAGNILDF